MTTRLKNIINFVCTPGVPVIHPHGLTVQNGRPVVPDCIEADASGFEITADDTNVTVVGDGTVNVLVESWHTIERVFGDKATLALIPQPFVVNGGGGVPTPPFAPGLVTIYARTTGSDTTGNGRTIPTAYRTMQRAVRDVPMFIPPGVAYRVDITGLDETLPDDYTLPAWKAPAIDVEPAVAGNLYTIFQAAVEIYATPQPVAAIPLADTVIAFADVASVTADPITGLKIITLNAPRASWVAGSTIKGKQVIDASNAGKNSVVAKVTASVIHITTSGTPDFPLTLVEPGAFIHGSGNNLGTIGALNIDRIGFTGIKITSDNGALGLVADGSGGCMCQLCELDSPSITQQSGSVVFQNSNRAIGCWIYNFPTFSGVTIIASCLIDGATPTSNFDDPFFSVPIALTLRQTVFNNGCDPVEITSYEAGGNIDGAATPHIDIQNCLFDSGNGDGFIFHGVKGHITNSDFANNAGNGITVNAGGGLLVLDNVGSSVANTGIGLFVSDGMQVQADTATATSVTPLTGGTSDIQVGTLVAPTTWANFVIAGSNVPDYTGATATGARLFT